MQQIRIDFDNPGLPQSLGAVEGESQSRIFQAALYKSGAAYTAPAGAVYSIMYRGFGPQNQGWYDTIEDGAGKRAACIVSGNVVTCELARKALRVPGHLTVVLCVSDAKGYMLKSWPIMADVRNDGYEDTGESEMYFNLSGIAGNYLTQLEKAMANAETTKNNLTSTSAQVQKDIDAKAAAALKSIPEEYTELDGSVKRLEEDLGEYGYIKRIKAEKANNFIIEFSISNGTEIMVTNEKNQLEIYTVDSDKLTEIEHLGNVKTTPTIFAAKKSASYIKVWATGETVFKIYSLTNGLPKVEYVEIPSINNRIEKIETQKNSTYDDFTVFVKNTQNIPLTNFPIQIKAKFDKGEVFDEKQLSVLNENKEEIPYQLELCDDANSLRNSPKKYYPDGSVKAATIWIIDTISENETAKYILRQYPLRSTPSTRVFAPKVTISGSEFPFKVYTNLGNQYNFEKRGLRGGIDLEYSNCNNYIKYNDNIIQMDSLTNVSVDVQGNGVIFYDIIYNAIYNEIKFKVKYRVFGCGIVCCTTSVYPTSSINGDVVTEYKSGISINAKNVEVKDGSYCYSVTGQTTSNKFDVVPIVASGNVNRGGGKIPTYSPLFEHIFKDNNFHLNLGWNNPDTSYPMPKGIIFDTKYYIISNGDGKSDVRIYNPPIGIPVKYSFSEYNAKIFNLAEHHLSHIVNRYSKDYFEVNDTRKIQILYALLINNSIDEQSVTEYFKEVYSTATSGEAIYQNFKDGNSIYSAQILGKDAPVALYMYEYCTKRGLSESAEYYKDLCIYFGKFYSIQYKNNGDFFLNSLSWANNNSRAAGLYCISQALIFAHDDDMLTAYHAVRDILIKNNSLYNSILPDGNMVKERYIHYEAYAVAKIIAASILMNEKIPDFSTRFLDYVTPCGQVKDEMYEMSTERKGQGLTYAYLAFCFATQKNSGLSKMGINVMESYLENDLADGSVEWPLDGYPQDLKGSNSPLIGREEIAEMYNLMYFAKCYVH